MNIISIKSLSLFGTLLRNVTSNSIEHNIANQYLTVNPYHIQESFMQRNVCFNAAVIICFVWILVFTSVVSADETIVPGAVTIRYMIIQAGPIDKWGMDIQSQSIFPMDGACIVLDPDPNLFLEKVKMVWPQYDCKSLASGSVTCENNGVYQGTIDARPEDPNGLAFEIVMKPRVNKSDKSVTVYADIKQSSKTALVTAESNPDIKLPVMAISRITTTRRLHVGRTYSLGGTLFENNIPHEEKSNSVVLFAICALPASK